MIEIFEVNLSGGGVHCITNDQPALSNLQGDLNQDGEVNVLDVVITISMILENEFSTDADLNQDGMVNVVDIIILVNLILES